MLEYDARLSEVGAEAILDPGNELFLSPVSYWEICIKLSIGKLTLRPDWAASMDQEMAHNGIQWLTPGKEDYRGVIDLPWIHRDPFDRLLIAQAIGEKLTLITADEHIHRYEVACLW